MSKQNKFENVKWQGTSLNLLARQKYRCSTCGHKDWWNYSHMQWKGRMIKKPWSLLPWFRPDRPTQCAKCEKKLDFAYGSGIDSWRDSYVPYWRGLFTILTIVLGGGFYLSHFHDIQIFEELAKFLFGGMQIN